MAAFFAGIRRLSVLYRKLETCGKPWAAAINGLCVGGAFELALACHYRVMADVDSARVGLPEIRVGLFPGAGGTQRIARLMPTADALQMLLKGEQIGAKAAKARGLVHLLAPAGEIVGKAKEWIKAGGKAVAPWDEPNFRLPSGRVHSAAGMMIWPAANAIYRRETYDNYPAARALLQAAYDGLQLPIDLALEVESRAFIHVLASKEAGAMIRSLFVSLGALNKGARRPAGIAPSRAEEDRHYRRRLHGGEHRLCQRARRLRRRADRPRSGKRRQGQGGVGKAHRRRDHEGPGEIGRARRSARRGSRRPRIMRNWPAATSSSRPSSRIGW